MPFPARLRLTLAALFTLTMLAVCVVPASAQPTSGCRPDASRGSVPSTYGIDACVEHDAVVLRNNLSIAITVYLGGDTKDPVVVPSNFSLAAAATRLRYRSSPHLVLVPGDTATIPLGSGAATVDLHDTDPGRFYILATTVDAYVPATKYGDMAKDTYDALTGMIDDLYDAMSDREVCRVGKNFLQQQGCDITAETKMGVALGKGFAVGLSRGAAKAVLSAGLWSEVVAHQAPDVGTFSHGKRRISVAPTSPLGASSTLGARNDSYNSARWVVDVDPARRAGLGPLVLGSAGADAARIGVAKEGSTSRCPRTFEDTGLLGRGTDDDTGTFWDADGRLHAVFIRTSDWPTAAGIRVGDPMSKVQSAYGARAVGGVDPLEGTPIFEVRGADDTYVEFFADRDASKEGALPSPPQTYSVAFIVLGYGAPSVSEIDSC